MSRPLPCSPEQLARVARAHRVTVEDVIQQWAYPSVFSGHGRPALPDTIEEAAHSAYRQRKAIEAVAARQAEGVMRRGQELEKEFGFPVHLIWREKHEGDWPDDRSAAQALRSRAEQRRMKRPWWRRWWPW